MRDDLASPGPIPKPLASVPLLGLGIDHISLDSPDPSGHPLSHRPFQPPLFLLTGFFDPQCYFPTVLLSATPALPYFSMWSPLT